ncbi:hypothetical protein QT21_00075, partial [Staphylococcus aureus]
VVDASAAHRLDRAAVLLALETSLLGAEGGAGGTARSRAHRRLAGHVHQPLDRVLAVAFLGAGALGMDDDDALLGHALTGDALQPRVDIRRQHRAAAVVAQLCRGRQLVDVLAAGAGGANEADLDIVLVDCDRMGDP